MSGSPTGCREKCAIATSVRAVCPRQARTSRPRSASTPARRTSATAPATCAAIRVRLTPSSSAGFCPRTRSRPDPRGATPRGGPARSGSSRPRSAARPCPRSSRATCPRRTRSPAGGRRRGRVPRRSGTAGGCAGRSRPPVAAELVREHRDVGARVLQVADEESRAAARPLDDLAGESQALPDARPAEERPRPRRGRAEERSLRAEEAQHRSDLVPPRPGWEELVRLLLERDEPEALVAVGECAQERGQLDVRPRVDARGQVDHDDPASARGEVARRMRPELECAEERDPEHRQQRDAEPDPNATGAPRVPPQERRVSEREGRRATQRPSLPARTSVTSSRESPAVGASSDHASRRAGWTSSLVPPGGARGRGEQEPRGARRSRARVARCLDRREGALEGRQLRRRSVLERESATTGNASHAAATRARSAAAKSAIAPVVGATRYVGDGAETSAGSSEERRGRQPALRLGRSLRTKLARARAGDEPELGPRGAHPARVPLQVSVADERLREHDLALALRPGGAGEGVAREPVGVADANDAPVAFVVAPRRPEEHVREEPRARLERLRVRDLRVDDDVEVGREHLAEDDGARRERRLHADDPDVGGARFR